MQQCHKSILISLPLKMCTAQNQSSFMGIKTTTNHYLNTINRLIMCSDSYFKSQYKKKKFLYAPMINIWLKIVKRNRNIFYANAFIINKT